jgi:hypothetical protein
MDHRPYEDWLLDDERLTPQQDRDLRLHLRNCPACNALERANLSLRSSAVIAPAEGFRLRFQVRLAAQSKLQRRRSLIGLSLLAVVGMGGLFWLLSPYLPYLALPPAQLASLWISNLVYLALTARALSALGNTFLNVLGSLVPAYVWVLSIPLLAGLGFLWTVSFRRIGKTAQSAA